MKASKKLKYILILILIVMLSLAGPWGFGKMEQYFLNQIQKESQQENDYGKNEEMDKQVRNDIEVMEKD